jgi:hypothetical protein
LVRTPATAAGKRGRCPHCQRIVKIPKEVSRPARSTLTGPDADLGLAEEALEPASGAKMAPAPAPQAQGAVPAAPAKPKRPKLKPSSAAESPQPAPVKASAAASAKPVEIKVQEATPITDLTPPPPDPFSGLAPLKESEPEGLTPLPDLPADSFSTLTPLTSEPLTVLTPLPDDDPLGLGTLGTPGGYGAPIAAPKPIISDARRRGLPWEREPSLETFGETVKTVIAGPHEAFGSMRRSGGIGNPLGFLIVTSVLASMLLLIEFFLYQLVVLFFIQSEHAGLSIAWDRFFIRFGIMAVGMLFSALIGAALGGFINALILHLGLLMFGGANAGFEATYRVVAFGTGAVYMLLPIPLIGPFFASVMYFVVLIFGLIHAHETSGGRAVLAVLVPLGLAACCMAPVLLMFGSLPVMLSPMGRN